MAIRLVTLHLDPASANLRSVRAKFGLNATDADEDFGVVCVSPEKNLYAIMAEDTAADRIQGASGVKGVFANPKIETFGPPRK